MAKYDFAGWASRNDLKCSDGRTIRRDAFKDCDGLKVPLVWSHDHNNPSNVLGHAMLYNRPEGVWAECTFNNTPRALDAKESVVHGDVEAMSIWANKLTQDSKRNVLHGMIREVSLVLSGANPGAFIEEIACHGDDGEEAIIYANGFEPLELFHGDMDDEEEDEDEGDDETIGDVLATLNEKQMGAVMAVLEDAVGSGLEHSEDIESDDIEDIYHSLTEKQQEAVDTLVGAALESINFDNIEGGNSIMAHNIFDVDYEDQQDDILTHSDEVAIIEDAKRYGSLKDSFLAHVDGGDTALPAYGFANMDYLFPEAQAMSKIPEFINKPNEWVKTVMNGVHRSPFSRVKTLFADITMDEARAKGYIKAHMKKEEAFRLLKRSTDPTTIYKKQKMDRDDIIDITDFDVVSWIRGEMRVKLDEEIARAILVGDGRSLADEDHIPEDHIRPIWKDEDFFTIKKEVNVPADATDSEIAREFIRSAIKSRKDYRGSGSPTLFTTEDVLTDCLLIEDLNGRIIYDSEAKLATALRVSKIVTVPHMEGLQREVAGVQRPLLGIIVNLDDYNVGADKGGAISMFDDFDIDYNQQKYLIETRISGALTKPSSAIVLEKTIQA